jgi:hypothetical protein
MRTGRPKGAQAGAQMTIQEISTQTGIPRTTVHRDCERFRDLLALEAVFALLPRRVQRKWLEQKLAAV